MFVGRLFGEILLRGGVGGVRVVVRIVGLGVEGRMLVGVAMRGRETEGIGGVGDGDGRGIGGEMMMTMMMGGGGDGGVGALSYDIWYARQRGQEHRQGVVEEDGIGWSVYTIAVDKSWTYGLDIKTSNE